MASAPPFHMAMGVRLVGSASSRFGAGGSGGGGSLGAGAGERRQGKVDAAVEGGAAALSWRSWRNGVVGLGRGQWEFCGVGEALGGGVG
jgi:hypothetical protein